jgi:hypothetical protein
VSSKARNGVRFRRPRVLLPTSLRLPKALHDALFVATKLGTDFSVSAATRKALAERIRGFARQAAFNARFVASPDDTPRLAGVAKRRVSGTDHPAASEPGLVDEVAAEIEHREPGWALTALDDATLDRHDADRAAELRASVAAAPVVDACAAVTAERAASRGVP